MKNNVIFSIIILDEQIEFTSDNKEEVFHLLKLQGISDIDYYFKSYAYQEFFKKILNSDKTLDDKKKYLSEAVTLMKESNIPLFGSHKNSVIKADEFNLSIIIQNYEYIVSDMGEFLIDLYYDKIIENDIKWNAMETTMYVFIPMLIEDKKYKLAYKAITKHDIFDVSINQYYILSFIDDIESVDDKKYLLKGFAKNKNFFLSKELINYDDLTISSLVKNYLNIDDEKEIIIKKVKEFISRFSIHSENLTKEKIKRLILDKEQSFEKSITKYF